MEECIASAHCVSTRHRPALKFRSLRARRRSPAFVLPVRGPKKVVRARGLEPPILSEPDPKSGASAIPPRARPGRRWSVSPQSSSGKQSRRTSGVAERRSGEAVERRSGGAAEWWSGRASESVQKSWADAAIGLFKPGRDFFICPNLLDGLPLPDEGSLASVNQQFS